MSRIRADRCARRIGHVCGSGFGDFGLALQTGSIQRVSGQNEWGNPKAPNKKTGRAKLARRVVFGSKGLTKDVSYALE